MPNWIERQPPRGPRRKHATLADIDRALRPGLPGVTVCYACRGRLDLDLGRGEKVCRNPSCQKYVMSDYVRNKLAGE